MDRTTSRVLVAVVTAAVLLAACDSGSPRASGTPSPSTTPGRPLPTTTAELLTRLTQLADALETPGDGIAAQQARAQACIEVGRVRDHVSAYDRRLVHEKLELQLDLGADLCATSPDRAAGRLRVVVTNASATPVPSS